MTEPKLTPQEEEMKEVADTAALAPKPQESALATIDEQYLKDNARVGLEDMTLDDLPTPVLKVVNKETLRMDGQTPVRNGHLYYASLDLDLEVATVSFLSYTKSMQPVYQKPEETEKVYVVTGALDTNEGFKPFKMYFRKTGIGTFKRLLGQVVAMKVPMFALELELTTEKRTSQDGVNTYYTLNITNKGVRKDADEIPVLEDLARKYGAKVREEEENGETINGVPVAKDIPF